MAEALQERIDAEIKALPEEAQQAARDDLEWILNQTRLTSEDLMRLMANPASDTRARAVAAWLVGLIREKSFSGMLVRLIQSDAPEEIIWEAAKSLCTLGQGGALFRKLLFSSEADSRRRMAAYALGRLRVKSAVKDLCLILESPKEAASVRAQAAESLGYLAQKSSLPSLVRGASDPSPEVRFWAAFALGKIGGPKAEQVLKQMAERDHAYVEGWWEVAKEAAEALAEIRRGRS